MFTSRLVPSVASVTTIVFPVDLTLFLVAVASILSISATVAALKNFVVELNVATFALIEFSAVVALVASLLILVSSLEISDTVAALNVLVEALNVVTSPLIESSAAIALVFSD